MTIHDKIAVAVTSHVGKTLNTRQVQTLVVEKYPGTNPTSIIPSDHSGPNPRSGRFYCNCCTRTSQLFAHDHGSYRVLDRAGAMPGRVSVSGGNRPDRKAVLHKEQKIVIDDAFIREWHPKYLEEDEGNYEVLVATVAQEMRSTETFLAIWHWKGAMRVIRHVRIEDYDTLYAPAFRRAANEPSQRKLAALIEPSVKLPGVEAATGSTIIHFIHPESMPIIDVRTIGALFEAGLISTQQKDLAHYEEFRRAIEGIKHDCPNWNLRQIDRAPFAYHKQVLDKSSAGECRHIS